MTEVTNTVEYAPAIVNVDGKTKTERQLSVVYHASAQTKLALANAKGKVGAAARNGITATGLKEIARAAARNNYKPAAEYIAARTGAPFVISNRAAFDSLPDQFEAMVMKAKLAKNGGYTTDKKTGLSKPGAAMALAMELKAIAIDLIADKEAYIAQAKADKAAIAA